MHVELEVGFGFDLDFSELHLHFLRETLVTSSSSPTLEQVPLMCIAGSDLALEALGRQLAAERAERGGVTLWLWRALQGFDAAERVAWEAPEAQMEEVRLRVSEMGPLGYMLHMSLLVI